MQPARQIHVVSRHGAGPSPSEVREQLHRILTAPLLARSEVLRDILTFLGEANIESPGTWYKESELATLALGRRGCFDGRLDSTIRVHAARLRAKLAEYYAHQGADDPVILEIPKGLYQLKAVYRQVAPSPPRTDAAIHQNWFSRVGPGSAWLAAGILLALLAPNRHVHGPAAPPAVSTLFQSFTRSGRQTVVIFADRPVLDQNSPCTGGPSSHAEGSVQSGEVFALNEITTLFAEHWQPLRVKSRSLFTWDDGRNQNLVVIGAPCAGGMPPDLPMAERYRFVARPGEGDPVIEDLEALSGEIREYGHAGTPVSVDHAVVMLVRLDAGQQFLLLAGTTALGTQGAADLVCREDSASTLLGRLGVARGNFASLDGFEALLRVSIRNGVPIQSEIVGLRIRQRPAAN